MKKGTNRKWLAIPFFLIFSAVILIMAGISYSYNKLIFYVELLLAVVSIITVFLSLIYNHKYITSIVKKAFKGITGVNKDFLQDFKLPVAVTGDEGEILWANKRFFNEISPEHSPYGEYIENYFSKQSSEKAFSEKGLKVFKNKKNYTVYAGKFDEAAIYYFFDTTALENIREKYKNTRPCVVSVVFDNKEEFERNTEEDSLGTALALLESQLIKWTNAYNGSYRKDSNGRYFIIFEESEFKKIIDTKFDILDTARSIKSSLGLSVTLSLGAGRGGQSFKESELWAKEALEMALGRGGDQAVIKCNDDYRFFGGVSQGTHRRDKVRSRVIAGALSEKISGVEKVYIMGHSYSDLDCIGAGAGLYAVITKIFKKEAFIVVKASASPATPLIDLLKQEYDENMFAEPNDALKGINDKSLLIIVDTHSSDFIESKELYTKSNDVVVIDHHRMMVNHITNASIFYQETFASSASEMVSELVQYMGAAAITKPIAEALLAGIMLDTKSFTVKTGSRTFDASAFLCRKSADTITVKSLFANSLEEYKEKSELVFNAETFSRFAIAQTSKFTKNIRVTASQAADELLCIRDVDASFVIFPIEGAINISARSLGKVNVQLVMESLGGGGHLTMAAVQLKGFTAEQARELLIERLEEYNLQNKS